jgi:hypothetical protein
LYSVENDTQLNNNNTTTCLIVFALQQLLRTLLALASTVATTGAFELSGKKENTSVLLS